MQTTAAMKNVPVIFLIVQIWISLQLFADGEYSCELNCFRDLHLQKMHINFYVAPLKCCFVCRLELFNVRIFHEKFSHASFNVFLRIPVPVVKMNVMSFYHFDFTCK